MLDTFSILRKKVCLMWSMHIIASMLDCSWKYPLYLKCFSSNSRPTAVCQKQTYIPHSSSYYRHLVIKNKCRIFLILPVLSQLTAMAFNKSHYKGMQANMFISEWWHIWAIVIIIIMKITTYLFSRGKKKICSTVTSIAQTVIESFF